MTKDYLAENLAQFEDWSEVEIGILREIWEELKKTDSKKVELKLDELKDTCIVGQEHDTWDSVLETFPKKAIQLWFYKEEPYGEKHISVVPFISIGIEPDYNKMTIETIEESDLGFPVGKEKNIALDFLNTVLTEL